MKPAYYNEFDPHAAAWLRGLIAAGLIAAGWVDTRSITEVKPHELTPFAQCHFFAGIGGWSLALRLAGVPDAEPVWTGSPPCQPFSVAGKGLGFQDARDLWPVFRHLIRLCRPHRVFGEQVAAAITAGWLDRLHSDLEAEGYACGETILGAHSVGADHQRQRLYWMAESQIAGPHGRLAGEGNEDRRTGEAQEREWRGDAAGHSEQTGRLGHAEGLRQPGRLLRAESGLPEGGVEEPGDRTGRLVLTCGQGLEGHGGDGNGRTEPGRVGSVAAGSTAAAGFWADSLWIECRDRKRRRIPTQPSLFPLADGVSRADMDGVRSRLSGMGFSAEDVRALLREPRSLVAMASRFRSQCLRGAGNAIVPQAAAAFIQAFDTRKS